jgi:hypothetical protein
MLMMMLIPVVFAVFARFVVAWLPDGGWWGLSEERRGLWSAVCSLVRLRRFCLF